MDLWSPSYHDFATFLLILIRVGVVLFIFPFFNARIIPVNVKAGLTLILSLMLYPVTPISSHEYADTVWGMGQILLGEVIIGMILGLMIQMFFEAVRMMGQLVGFQTGFALANVIDPQMGHQVSILANMAYLLSIVLFLLLNGHHILLLAMKESFEVIQVGSVTINQQGVGEVMNKAADIFVIALRIGAPAIAALIFIKVAFGLITKFIPQMNVMIVAFPVQIIIGLLFFGICFGVLLRHMEQYLSELDFMLMHAMKWLAG